MKIQKYKLWLLFFFVIFGWTFGMIIWTVYNANKLVVQEDKSFLLNYHDVDEKFNKINFENKKFLSKYNPEIIVNNKKVAFDIKDIFLSQRIFDKYPNKNLLNIGKNYIEIKNLPKEAKIKAVVTNATTHKDDINLNFSNKAEFNITEKGFWNITGVITIGELKGYFYIKTNVKK